MLRKAGLCLLGIGLLFGTCAQAEDLMSTLISTPFSLKPNATRSLTNFMFGKYHIMCQLETEDESDLIKFDWKKGLGEINHVLMRAGSMLALTIHSKETLEIYASTGTSVNLKNEGQHTVYANCSLQQV